MIFIAFSYLNLFMGYERSIGPNPIMVNHHMMLEVSPTCSFNLWARYLSVLTVFRLSFLIWKFVTLQRTLGQSDFPLDEFLRGTRRNNV